MGRISLIAKIADIAADAGKSTASFYNYYESKDELLADLLQSFSSEVISSSPPVDLDNTYESIRSAVSAYVDGYRRYLPEMIALTQLSTTDDGYAERYRAHRSVGIANVARGSAERSAPGWSRGRRTRDCSRR